MKTLTQTGFKVSITINCETEYEIFAHLSAIRKEMKKHDENCYGTHEVKIEPDLA